MNTGKKIINLYFYPITQFNFYLHHMHLFATDLAPNKQS